jgi:oligosaccharide reducing-end xylanase
MTQRNLLAEYGYAEQAIEAKLDQWWSLMFQGPKDQRIYFEDGPDRGYMVDTGNNDVRTEGMSYGMMMAVQRGDRDVFDRLWQWSKQYLQHASGRYQHYFAWSAELNGTRRSEGPAPDGEEYFALALFFASHRWGDGPAPFDYAQQARTILSACVHQGERGGHPMWDPENALIRFVPETPWTDPSYHLPHFYDLFTQWADPEDRPFWKRAATASRAFLPLACHPETGLAPEYSEYDGRPHQASWDYGHHHFYSDSYRVAANLGLEALWSGLRPEASGLVDRLLAFFVDQNPQDLRMYSIDGTPLAEPALHPHGLIATNAMGALAAGPEPQAQNHARQAVELFWNTPLRTGVRRYYDNCLQFFALLALSGRYRIW